MGIYYFGEMLKRYRESLGMTQEKLCDGICSCQTLSLIENGRQKLGIAACQQMMERMGKEVSRVYALEPISDSRTKKDIQDYEKAMEKCDYETADKILGKMEQVLGDAMAGRQYILGGKAFISRKLQRITGEEERALLWEAMALSVPDPMRKNISRYPWLSHELLLLYGIANSYFEEGKCQETVIMLEDIQKSLESGYRISEQGQIFELMIIECLMNAYQKLGEHKKAFEYAEQGIAVSSQEKSSERLVQFLEGKAQCMGRLLEHGKEEGFTKEGYKEAIQQAVIIASALGKKKQKKRMEKRYKELFGEEVW